AESFVVDTIVPPVLLMPLASCRDHDHRPDDDCGCSDSVGARHVHLPIPVGGATNVVAHHGGGAGHGHGGGGAPAAPPPPATPPGHGGGKPDKGKKHDPSKDPSGGSGSHGDHHRHCVRVQ